jgi:putative two-component system response regulator
MDDQKQPIALIVDDNPRVLSAIQIALKMEGFQVFKANNGLKAIQLLEEITPDIIISDILMPEIDGLDFLEMVHSRPETSKIPFLFLTAMDNAEALERARGLGVDEYILKPFKLKDFIQIVRSRFNRSQELKNAFTIDAFLKTVETLANSVEGRDACTHEHINRVMAYAEGLAKTLDFKPEEIKQVRLAAILHDVGKVCIPDAILNKAGPLTDDEWKKMKQHTLEGEKILQPMKDLPLVLEGVRYHHERYDGKGYPDGLSGSDIPLIGRLLAVIDAFDAMTSDRPYRKGIPTEQALQELKSGAGKQFDPQIVNAFLDYWEPQDQKENG